MEEIISLLAHFQEELQVLTNDFQKIKNNVYNIYKENEKLKEENQNLKKLLFEKRAQQEKGEESGTGYNNNLSRLYEEGFHVCHLNFGDARKGECLFCIGLLDNNIEELEEVESNEESPSKEE